jgi:hypothetical protein
MPNQQALKSENFVKKIKFLFFLVAFDAIEDCTIYRCSPSLSRIVSQSSVSSVIDPHFCDGIEDCTICRCSLSLSRIVSQSSVSSVIDPHFCNDRRKAKGMVFWTMANLCRSHDID